MGFGAAREFTAAEAAAVAGLSKKAIDNAFVKKVVPAVAPKRAAKPAPGAAAGHRRKVTEHDLVWLRLLHGAEVTIPEPTRRKLLAQFRTNLAARELRAGDFVVLDLEAARKAVEQGVRTLKEAEQAICSDEEIMGGEPVFKGTRIPVYGIVAMLNAGTDPDELLEGYPKLNPRLLELAKLWAKAHPQRGRPPRLRDLGLKRLSRRTFARSG